jgi:hypothetical protein
MYIPRNNELLSRTVATRLRSASRHRMCCLRSGSDRRFMRTACANAARISAYATRCVHVAAARSSARRTPLGIRLFQVQLQKCGMS